MLFLFLTLQSGGGTLTFADQQRYTYITIPIRDNNIAELDKTFQVQLSSPTQGGKLGEIFILTLKMTRKLFLFSTWYYHSVSRGRFHKEIRLVLSEVRTSNWS